MLFFLTSLKKKALVSWTGRQYLLNIGALQEFGYLFYNVDTFEASVIT